ncbi:MAG: hypothetical protein HFJ45_00785 [Clostridia bacterium]|nr:hypothetical protein [Clostridia bacterium]
MSKDLIIKKCKKCGAIVKVIEDCKCNGCGIKCCDEEMEVLTPNSVDAAVEKHVPVYEIKGDKVVVKVNHVMEDEHYIEWVSFVHDNKECTKYLKPGEVAEVEFKYVPGSKLYAYCNKHGLWKKDVE